MTLDEVFVLSRSELMVLAGRIADGYQTATPFPHIFIDDFVPASVVQAAAAEFPMGESAGWTVQFHKNSRKLATNDHAAMGPVCRQLVSEFHSAPMVDFLERLTGISGLIPDPHLWGGGLHQTERGGFLSIHADFNRHERLGLDRRINVILYLNRVWDDEWGGKA